MRNIEQLAKDLAKNGAENIIVHTVPGSSNWIICSKVGEDRWIVTIGNPMGSVKYDIGVINNKEHLKLWIELIKAEIKKKTTTILKHQAIESKGRFPKVEIRQIKLLKPKKA